MDASATPTDPPGSPPTGDDGPPAADAAGPERADGDPGEDRLARVPWYTAPGLLVGIPILAWIITLLRPSFYHEVIWRYYWGPIVADAAGGALTRGGVTADPGYNLVNTLSWAVLLGIAILGLAQFLRHYRQPMDTRLIVGATAWVVAGSLWHVIEDTDLMGAPLQYFFITPIIYLVFAALGIASYVIGQLLRGIERRAGQELALRQLWLLLLFLVLGYTVLWARDWGQIVHYVNPVVVAVAAAATHLLVRFRARRAGKIVPTDLVLTLSTGWFVLAFAYILAFILDPWRDAGTGMPSAVWLAPLGALAALAVAWWAPTRPLAYAAALPLSVLGTVLVVSLLPGLIGRLGISVPAPDLDAASHVFALVGVGVALWAVAVWRLRARPPSDWGVLRRSIRHPVGALLIFGQCLDGFATSLGLDFAGYQEKHVLSKKVIDTGHTMWSSVGATFAAEHPTLTTFFPLKFALALLVLWAMDVVARDDAKANPNLMGIVKFAIIMVGLGPGVRDFVRLALGI